MKIQQQRFTFKSNYYEIDSIFLLAISTLFISCSENEDLGTIPNSALSENEALTEDVNELLGDSSTITLRAQESKVFMGEVNYGGIREPFPVRIDYSIDNQTGIVREAYAGVLGSGMYTWGSKQRDTTPTRVDLVIKADYKDAYGNIKRLVIAVSFYPKTNTCKCEVMQEGSGSWADDDELFPFG